jgi:predicted phage terminase large subunit-like protein
LTASKNNHPDDVRAFDALMREDLASFVVKTFHTVDPGAPYLHNWHIDLIAEYLTACYNRDITRLVINIPPRYMKSITATVAFPAWLLGKDPAEKIIAASYSGRLSVKHSIDTRLVVNSPWYKRAFPGTALVSDQNEKSKFMTTARGHRIATSVGGTATGEGGDFLIVDDPHNPKMAASEVERQTALDWFDQTFYSRLNDKKKGVIILVMQRLHEKDLAGHVLESGEYEHLKIPAIAERKTIIDFGSVKITREPGDLLHKDREGPAEMERTKKGLGSYGFAGQYQQNPVPAEGGMIKHAWIKRYKTAPKNPTRIIQSWDTAYKTGQINDPSVCTTWAETATGWYLLHVWRDRVDYPRLKSTVKSLFMQYSPAAVLVEDKASGQSLIQEIRATTRIPVIPIHPETDKVTRMSSQSAQIESGQVYFPESAPWLADLETELFRFPLTDHDDQVDSISQFLKYASGGANQYAYTPVKKGTTGFNRKGAW